MNWKELPEQVPEDEQECWIRIKYYYGQPFKAIWSEGLQNFMSVDNDIVYPAWSVSRWLPVE